MFMIRRESCDAEPILDLMHIHSVSIVSQLAAAIRQEIVRGDLGPEAELFEGELAKKYGVSVASARQTLLFLEHEGLVNRTPRKGAAVINFTRKQIKERNQVRVPLEILACRLARRSPLTSTDYQTLEQFIEQMPAAENSMVDFAFHQYLWRKSGNQTLERTLTHLVGPLFAFVNLSRWSFNNLDDRMTAHRELLTAIRTGTRGDMVSAVKRHVESAYQRFFDEGHADLRAFYDAFPRRVGVSLAADNREDKRGATGR
jgi:DNA-binding GntR family transcriptional regulator